MSERLNRKPLTIDQDKFECIRADLCDRYPTLNIFTNRDGATEVAGRFPVLDNDGKELESFSLSIILPSAYPTELPIVFEVGGKIPRTAERHVFSNGSACVFIPDDRWRCFPASSSFIDYLDGPLRNYFLSQLYYEETGKWLFGEYSHNEAGIIEYYQELFEIQDISTVINFLFELCENKLRKQHVCPCGSGRKLKKCCLLKCRELRKKITPEMALTALRRLYRKQLLYREAALYYALRSRYEQAGYLSKSS